MIRIKLPRANNDFEIDVDDRGIILEDRIDPNTNIKIWQIPILYFMTARQIDRYLRLDMPDI